MQPPPPPRISIPVTLSRGACSSYPHCKACEKLKVNRLKKIEVEIEVSKTKSIYVPVVNSGRVGLLAVEVVSSDGSGGEVAAGVEDAPPHVVLPRRRRARRRRSRRHGQRSLVLAAFAALHSDI